MKRSKEMSKFCPNCGNKISSNESLFCNRCGYKLSDNVVDSVNHEPTSIRNNTENSTDLNDAQAKGIIFLQAQATKIDEEKKKYNKKTTAIVLVIVAILVIIAVILSIYVLFFIESKSNDSSSLRTNNSQANSSMNDSSVNDANSSRDDLSSTADSSSEVLTKEKPIQERDIESVVAENEFGVNQYTTLINTDDKSVVDCLNKFKKDKLAVTYYKDEKYYLSELKSTYKLQDSEKYDEYITVTTIQNESHFQNPNNINITFHNGKLYDQKDVILKSLINEELAEYIINGNGDKTADFKTSCYLNNKEIKVDYERAKKEDNYVINITYNAMDTAAYEEDKAVIYNNIYPITNSTLLKEFKAPLSSYFTTKSKEAADFKSMESGKGFLCTALKYLKTVKPVAQTNIQFDEMTLSDDGNKMLKFRLDGLSGEKQGDVCCTMECEFRSDKNNKPVFGMFVLKVPKANKEDETKKDLNAATEFLYPGIKVDAQGKGEVSINGTKYKIEIKFESFAEKVITIQRVS